MNRNKILLIVFGVLLAIFLVNQFLGSDHDRNFRSVLVDIDTAAVTKIVVTSKANAHHPITLVKTAGLWSVTNDTINDEADLSAVKGMLSSLVNMTPKRLVAKSEDKWAHYEVNDSLGTQVQVFGEEEPMVHLVIGKFTFQRASRSASTFVRLDEEDAVYAVEGLLSSTFNQSLDDLRDRTFLKTEKTNLTSLHFDYPGDSSFMMQKTEDQWEVDKLPADSAAVAQYLNGLRNLSPGKFVDNFTADGKEASYQLTIDGNNMSTITIKGYQQDDNLILHSSLNKNAFFEKGNLDVFEQLFVSKDSLLADPGME